MRIAPHPLWFSHIVERYNPHLQCLQSLLLSATTEADLQIPREHPGTRLKPPCNMGTHEASMEGHEKE